MFLLKFLPYSPAHDWDTADRVFGLLSMVLQNERVVGVGDVLEVRKNYSRKS